ncbi:S-layer homology domain-containing protein [Paenibacillus sp. 3LSP]|uniref:S-layer homology domain-containing protein n=2 Tax=Paenibacillus TaxID=44249 RepID=UPI000687BBB5|nr:S-layer homology domain-containing protein [Paenibacillus sp. 3LSP]MDU0331905.1 S-layer homology domain-containing protein [Paenibacillus sp. 3LSP]
MNVKKMLVIGLVGLMLVSLIPGKPHLHAASGGFPDVKEGHWAKAAIESAVAKGYFKGYADGTFKPNGTVTRAEFAALLARVAKAKESEESEASGHSFSDLAGHWSEPEVERAVALGFIQPSDYPNGFQPNTPITRFEMAKWMTSGLAANSDDFKQALEDTKTTVIPVREYFKPGIPESKSSYVAVALGTKLMSGYPDGTFGLDKKATRAETAIILQNYEQVSSREAGSFLGLNELREVGTQRTNMETISPFTTGNNPLTNVVDKTLTFRNHAGSVKLRNYIITDSEDFKDIKSIYAPLFIDQTDYDARLDRPGRYRAYIQITIYPKTKDFDLGHYMNGSIYGLVNGSRIANTKLTEKYGYLTLPNMYTKEFFKEHNSSDGITLWVETILNIKTSPGDQLTTDDGSFSSLRLK